MEIIKIKSGDSTAEIYAYGATVTSWRVKNDEKLFLSTKGTKLSFFGGFKGHSRPRLSQTGRVKSDPRWHSGRFSQLRPMGVWPTAWLRAHFNVDGGPIGRWLCHFYVDGDVLNVIDYYFNKFFFTIRTMTKRAKCGTFHFTCVIRFALKIKNYVSW